MAVIAMAVVESESQQTKSGFIQCTTVFSNHSIQDNTAHISSLELLDPTFLYPILLLAVFLQ